MWIWMGGKDGWGMEGFYSSDADGGVGCDDTRAGVDGGKLEYGIFDGGAGQLDMTKFVKRRRRGVGGGGGPRTYIRTGQARYLYLPRYGELRLEHVSR